MDLRPISLQPVHPWQAWLGAGISLALLFVSFSIPTAWQQLVFLLTIFLLIIAYSLIERSGQSRQENEAILFELVEIGSVIVTSAYVYFLVVAGTIPIILVVGAAIMLIVHTYLTFRLVLFYFINEQNNIKVSQLFELALDITIYVITLVWIANFEVVEPLTYLGFPLIISVIIVSKEIMFVTSNFLLVMQIDKVQFSTVSSILLSWAPLLSLIIVKFEFALATSSWSMSLQLLLFSALLRFASQFFPSRLELFIRRQKTIHFEYVRVYFLSFIVIGMLLYFVFNNTSIGINNMMPQLLVIISIITLRTWLLVRSKQREGATATKLEEALLDGLTKDELTGAPNRIAIEQFITSQMARNDGVDRFIITIDIDGFKLVNESLGHATGDEVLLLVTDRIKEVASHALFFGRLASDKFVVIVESGEDTVEKLANDYLARIIDSYTLNDGKEIRIGCSAGVSYINPKMDLFTNMELADAAITEAKFIGRGTVASRSATSRGPQINKVVRDAFAKAIATKDFGLRWTPKVNLKTGDIVGNAATLFWHANPTLPVKQLHLLADEERLSSELAAIVLELACAVIAKTQQPLTIGLRGQDLLNTRLPEHINRLAAQYSTGLSEIEFMLIDRSRLSRDSHTDIAVEKLRNLGITLTLSEFGSGFFSFEQMRSIEVDAISVDDAVITQVLNDPKLFTVLESIVIAAAGINLPVTAVGIETERIAEKVSQAGCIFGIGPWFGRQSTMLFSEAETLRRSALLPSSSFTMVSDYQ